MQHAPPPSDNRFPASARQEPVYTASAYGSAAGAYNQYPQAIQGQPEARTDGQQTFRMNTVVESPEPAARRTRKRKTPPPQSTGAPAQSSGPGQQQFASYAGAGGEAGQQTSSTEQTQQSSGYSLDPGMQAFVGDANNAEEADREERATSGPHSPSGSSRPVNPSKRAEQNRKAQRAFRERRDAHVKELEQRSQALDQVMMDLNDTNRRFEECRHMVDALRAENQRLTAALQQYTGGQLPPGFSQPAYTSNNSAPPPEESSTQGPAAASAPLENVARPAGESSTAPESANAQETSDDAAGQDEEGRKSKRAKR